MNCLSSFPSLIAAGSNAALVTFLVYTCAVLLLAAFSNRLLRSKSFLSEYFLGSRGLGMWAFALTFAATSASGGSFTGFPSKIYSHGWILGLWIGSYIVVPICAMGLLGKRLNQVARLSGAITVPDVLRDRFRSSLIGLLSVSLIVFFMSFNLVAQFKAGSLILKTLLSDVVVFQDSAVELSHWISGIRFLDGVDPAYLLCLVAFGIAVIVYTTYGGFHAVVWTDVMQGFVMVIGVIIMLPLAIWQVGGLGNATRQMIDMKPPEPGVATLRLTHANTEGVSIPPGSWIQMPAGGGGEHESTGTANGVRLFRVVGTTVFPATEVEVHEVQVLELKTTADIDRVISKQADRIVADVRIEDVKSEPYVYGAAEDQSGVYVTGPGPSRSDPNGFLPLSLAVSFFFMWAISGAGQPSSMVRLMAFKDSTTLRRSIFTVAVYYSLIYFPLVIIFCCARVLLPGMDLESDRIMPEMAVFLTENIGLGWLAGLLVAAPFAAVMSTVDSFLLMISSAMVRDIYQRNISPQARERTMKYLSYFFTLLVGAGAMLGAVNPPDFLQDIIVYTGSGLSACFLAPMIFGLYWPRSNLQGCVAGMLAGFAAHLAMYIGGAFVNGSFFQPYRLFNFDPIIVGLVASFATTYIATRLTPAPPVDLVRKYFYRSAK